jgi:hypothetical protein
LLSGEKFSAKVIKCAAQLYIELERYVLAVKKTLKFRVSPVLFIVFLKKLDNEII